MNAASLLDGSPAAAAALRGPTAEEAEVMLAARTTRVTKTIWPPRSGTVRFLQQHGPQLVCVRYRRDANGLCRFTTIELLVDAAWLHSAKSKQQRLAVNIAFEEVELRALARARGGKWNPDRRAWELPGEAVQQLHLAHRVRAGQRRK